MAALGPKLWASSLQRALPWVDRTSARLSANIPVVEAALARLDPTLSLRAIRARVVAVHEETHDVKTYVLRPNARFGTFRPGSYVTLHLSINGRPVRRTYSLSSAPSRDGLLAITVKRVPGGLVSNWLADTLVPGDVLELTGPQGQFVLPSQPVRKLLMISAGSGITPVMSMLRHLVNLDSKSEITFVHFARSPRDLIFGRELTELAERLPNLRVVTCVEEANESWTGLRGRFTSDMLDEVAPEFRTMDSFLCGPSPFMKAVMQAFERAEADLSKLRYELFSPEFDVSAVLDRAQVVRFAKSNVEALSNRPLTVLAEAEARGVQIESGCRAGRCGTCRCRKKRGRVVNMVTGATSGDGEEMIYACVSVPQGTVEVDL